MWFLYYSKRFPFPSSYSPERGLVFLVTEAFCYQTPFVECTRVCHCTFADVLCSSVLQFFIAMKLNTLSLFMSPSLSRGRMTGVPIQYCGLSGRQSSWLGPGGKVCVCLRACVHACVCSCVCVWRRERRETKTQKDRESLSLRLSCCMSWLCDSDNSGWETEGDDGVGLTMGDPFGHQHMDQWSGWTGAGLDYQLDVACCKLICIEFNLRNPILQTLLFYIQYISLGYII